MFNITFDRLIPCVAGRKTFTNRDKMVPIQDGGKVSMTDEAFTALAISNYWAKWRSGGVPKWTDTRLHALEAANLLLRCQVASVTTIGAADKFQLMQVRKMVKENLFKKVKFINTPVVEAAAMAYLAKIFAIKPEEQRDWIATFAPYVRDALNNKRNNVAQDLKAVVKGMHHSILTVKIWR